MSLQHERASKSNTGTDLQGHAASSNTARLLTPGKQNSEVKNQPERVCELAAGRNNNPSARTQHGAEEELSVSWVAGEDAETGASMSGVLQQICSTGKSAPGQRDTAEKRGDYTSDIHNRARTRPPAIITTESEEERHSVVPSHPVRNWRSRRPTATESILAGNGPCAKSVTGIASDSGAISVREEPLLLSSTFTPRCWKHRGCRIDKDELDIKGGLMFSESN
ncbi:unnamed protein product [Pleuronectes platessa]|uniref:Uncharacterized protein n=1 Tax=Pleuronectes platessa TaxID=8262 RepID=A0A9N7TVP2_PLEPL|nr:unnamed protein product [Pleuronectes platessa]